MVRQLMDRIAKLFGYSRSHGLDVASCSLTLVNYEGDTVKTAQLGIFVSTSQRKNGGLVVYVDHVRVDQVFGHDYLTLTARLKPMIMGNGGPFVMRPDSFIATPTGAARTQSVHNPIVRVSNLEP